MKLLCCCSNKPSTLNHVDVRRVDWRCQHFNQDIFRPDGRQVYVFQPDDQNRLENGSLRAVDGINQTSGHDNGLIHDGSSCYNVYRDQTS